MSDLYLMHHGVKGMKWGIRRYQNEDGTLTEKGKVYKYKINKKVNSMYDHSKKWTDRKVEKLDRKGKNAKRDVFKYMSAKNEKDRKAQLDKIAKMSIKDIRREKKLNNRDYITGAQEWMGRNQTLMVTPIARLYEYNRQRGMRWMSNITFNSQLNRMTPKEGYHYLDNKNRYARAYNSRR